jgi:HAD superfamily hydrolase (TIGR01490 family)
MKHKTKNNKKPIAVFDIDGTIFRSSLLVELNKKMVEKGFFPKESEAIIQKFRSNWLNRKGSYMDYINAAVDIYHQYSKGCCIQVLRRCGRAVIAQKKNRVYVYTRELIKKLKPHYTLILLSHSPAEVVNEFNKYYHFDIAFGSRHIIKNGICLGEVDGGFDKERALKDLAKKYDLSLKNSIGVGDTESDIGFLKLMDHPICFNPNKPLYQYALKKKWRIVVERKDVIYQFLGKEFKKFTNK